MFFNRKVELVDTSGLHGLSLGFDLDPNSLYTYLENISKGETNGLPPPATCELIKSLLDVKQQPARRRPRRPRVMQNYNRNTDKIGTMTKEAMADLLETTSTLLRMRVSRRKGLALVVIAELGVNLAYLEDHLPWPILRALLWPLQGTEPPPGATTKVFCREWKETDLEVGALYYHRWVLRALERGTVSPILLMPRTPNINTSASTGAHEQDTPETLSLTRVLGLDMPEMPTPPATPRHTHAPDDLGLGGGLGVEGIVGVGGITPIGSPDTSDAESDSGGHDSDTDEVWVGTGGRVFEDAEDDETEAAALARDPLLAGAHGLDLGIAHHTPDISTLEDTSADTADTSVRRVSDFVEKYIGMAPEAVKEDGTDGPAETIKEEGRSDVLVPLWPGSSRKVSVKVMCVQLLYELGRFHSFRNNYQNAYECFSRVLDVWRDVCELPEEADEHHRIIAFSLEDATNWMLAVMHMLQGDDAPLTVDCAAALANSKQGPSDADLGPIGGGLGLQGKTALQIYAQQYMDVEKTFIGDNLTDELSDAFRYSVQCESDYWAEIGLPRDSSSANDPKKDDRKTKSDDNNTNNNNTNNNTNDNSSENKVHTQDNTEQTTHSTADSGHKSHVLISWGWRMRILNAIKGSIYNRTSDPAIFHNMNETQCKAAMAYFLTTCDQLRARYRTLNHTRANGLPRSWSVCRQRLCRLAQMAHFCTKDLRTWMDGADAMADDDVIDFTILGATNHNAHTNPGPGDSRQITRSACESDNMDIDNISDTTDRPMDESNVMGHGRNAVRREPETQTQAHESSHSHKMPETDAVTSVFCTDSWDDFVKSSELSRALNLAMGDGDESWITGELPQKMLAKDAFAREGMGRLSHSEVLLLGLPSKLLWHNDAQAYTYTGVDYSLLDPVDSTGQLVRTARLQVGGGPWGGGGGGLGGSGACTTTQQLERDVYAVAKKLECMIKQVMINEQGASIDRVAVTFELCDVHLVREGMIRACVVWRKRCHDNAEKFLRGVCATLEDLEGHMRDRLQLRTMNELVVPALKAIHDCSQRVSWHIATVLADKVNKEAQEMFKVGYELSDQSECADALIKELEVCTADLADKKAPAYLTQPQLLSVLCALANVGLSPGCGLWESVMAFANTSSPEDKGVKRRHPDGHPLAPRDSSGLSRQHSSANDSVENTHRSTAQSIYSQAPHSANNYLKFICNLAGRVSGDSDDEMDDDDDTRAKDVQESTEEQRTEMRDDFELFLLQLAMDVENSPHKHETNVKPIPTPTAPTHLPLLSQVMSRLYRKDLVLGCMGGLALALDLVSPVQRPASSTTEAHNHKDPQNTSRGSKPNSGAPTDPPKASDKASKRPHFKCINTPTTGPRHDLNKVLKDGCAVVADSAAQAGRGIRLTHLRATGAVATQDLKKNATYFFHTLGTREPPINNDHWDASITSACVAIFEPRACVELKRGDPTLTLCLADVRYHCGLYQETLRLFLQLGVTVTDFFGSVGPLLNVWNQRSLRKMVHSLVHMRAFVEASVLAQLISEKGNVTRQAILRMAYNPPASTPTPYTDIDTHTQRSTVSTEGYAMGVPVVPIVNNRYFHYFWDQTTVEILLSMCAERNVPDHQRLAAQLYSDRGANWCNVAEVQKAWALDRQKKFLIELAHDFMP
ncbi:hypothetical protein, variant [Sphaeroforma arctica JP610]|uniref:INTS8 TPR repeats domain-containing protein n=1 Tax=Sphaeroforma arctica JP610 TaxID=667725 RepID=A0A0L0G536_9EUKA|nr:hypothetical protein, variant [Sphaeroforma arctica JP610]KNC84135.1 hypothetical protein, variant [Sphaeroforma arctica JP610]|eukprot:XP_014158037.1 hypothetical protein, variant [Sphaeroforma arctica JP610]